MFCVYRVGFVLLALTSVYVLSLATGNIKKKTVNKVAKEDEVHSDEITRNRRDLRIGMFSPLICRNHLRRKLRNGRDVEKTRRDARATQLGFFTEVHCRRISDWLNHARGHVHGHKIRDCQDVKRYYNKRWSTRSDVYTIHPKGGNRIRVYCDMKTTGGGWTVLQHRHDGSLSFNRSWADYKNGFGNLHSNFWLGNDNIHKITRQGKYKVRIELEDFSGNKRYAEYSNFSVADENRKYKLHIGSYSGTAGNALYYNNNMVFSTKDRDNDVHRTLHCAVHRNGGWWHRSCTFCNINGLYINRQAKNNGKYNYWYQWPGGMVNMKTSTMMIRRI